MDKPKVTPKDFFLWVGAMVALYWSVIAFILLIFNYIDYAFPNPLSYLPSNPYDSGIGHEMASIIVLFPTYIILMWLIRSDISRDNSKRGLWIRRWALIFTLFVAGATVLGDLISVLTKFLSGDELTTGFLLKTLILLLVAAGAFMHFIADFWGYWEENEGRKKMVCYATGFLAVLVIVAGFALFGTPQKARQYRFDEQRVSDMQNIQSQVVYFWQAKQKMPVALSDLTDSISGYTAPIDPQTSEAYEYKVLGPHSFEVCATFNAETRDLNSVPTRLTPADMKPLIGGEDMSQSNWYHGAGRTCFMRTIDPERYLPLSKQAR